MTVYILHSIRQPDERYIGSTGLPLRARLARHNSGTVPSTARCRPWAVTTAIWLPDSAKARALERYLKSGSGRAFAKRHF